MLEAILTILFFIVLVHVLIIAVAYFWEWFYFAPTSQDETSYLVTEDGRRLAVHRYRPEAGARGHPVILCHGTFSNRYIFDLPGGASLARFLKQHGRDVWVAELRGAGMSAKPRLFRSDVPYSWRFEDHLHQDLPAVIRHVLQRTGSTALHWVGHSMGGLLIEAYMAANQNPPLASAVAVGSPCDFSKVGNHSLHSLLHVKWLVELYPICPLFFVARLLIPFAHKFRSLGVSSNIEPDAARKVITPAHEAIASKGLCLDLCRWLESKLFSPENGPGYIDDLSRCPVPLLVLAGSRDELAPEATVTAACETGGNAVERKLIAFGKATGYAEDYGHADLFVGKRVESEVFPVILKWLEGHD